MYAKNSETDPKLHWAVVLGIILLVALLAMAIWVSFSIVPSDSWPPMVID